LRPGGSAAQLGAIGKGRRDDEVCLFFHDLEAPGYSERVHPHRHALAMVFEHPLKAGRRANGRQ